MIWRREVGKLSSTGHYSGPGVVAHGSTTPLAESDPILPPPAKRPKADMNTESMDKKIDAAYIGKIITISHKFNMYIYTIIPMSKQSLISSAFFHPKLGATMVVVFGAY